MEKKKSKQPKAERSRQRQRRRLQPKVPDPRTHREDGGGAVDLTSRVYKLVVERGKDGVLQSEIWKELGLTRRDGSRLAIRLENRGMI